MTSASLPSQARTNITTPADEAAMLATNAIVGDLALRADKGNDIYQLIALPATDPANWRNITPLGVNQAWSDNLLGTEVLNNVTYTNTTDRAITVAIHANSSNSTGFAYAYVYVDGKPIQQNGQTGATHTASSSAVVPSGSTYSVLASATEAVLCYKLR